MDKRLKAFVSDFIRPEGLKSDDVVFNGMAGDGSKRIFWRIILPGDSGSFIVMVNTPFDSAAGRENMSYLMIGTHLRRKGLPVPEIFRYDLEHGMFIMEDMGKESLQDMVLKDQNPLPVYENVIETLVRLQIKGAENFDPAWCCQTERYDMEVMIRFEAHYFRDAFLGLYLGLEKYGDELESSFLHLAESASGAESGFFLHRDFQSRNIMIKDGRIGIVDWQGGRLGPLGYDLASLILDPYTDIDAYGKERMYQIYLSHLRSYNKVWEDKFKRSFPYLAIQRNLQILGAFSFLSKKMNKPYFEKYIPGALKTLKELLNRVKDTQLIPLRSLVKSL